MTDFIVNLKYTKIKMKKFLMFAAMFAALLSCEKPGSEGEGGQGGQDGKPTADKISVNPGTYSFGATEKLTCSVKVESSGDWTLTPANSEWLHPSVTKGKDGATVRFTADPNNDVEKRGPVTFTFKVGKATATFKAEQIGKDEVPVVFELLDKQQANLEIAKDGGKMQIKLNTTFKTSEIKPSISFKNGKDWISAPVMKEVDGVVACEFDVQANQGVDRSASLVMLAGFNAIEVAIVQKGVEVEPGSKLLAFQNPEDANMVIASNFHPTIRIQLNTNVPDDQIEIVVKTENGEAWLQASKVRIKKGLAILAAVPNYTEFDRKATVTFRAKDGSAQDLLMNLTQKAYGVDPNQPEPEKPANTLEFENPAHLNVTIPAEGISMQKYRLKTTVPLGQLSAEAQYIDGDGWMDPVNWFMSPDLTLNVEPNNGAPRKGKVIVKAKDGSANDLVMNITQEGVSLPEPEPQPSGLNVAKFDKSQLYSDWANAAPLTNMSKFTAEFLVNVESFAAKSWGQEALTTFLGIENYFLVRASQDKIEVVTNKDGEQKLALQDPLAVKKWYHIAVTFDAGKIKLYINGVAKGDLNSRLQQVTFATGKWAQEQNWGSTRHFYLGHSVDANRGLNGVMSEVRIWNKVLQASDLTAGEHFYNVDPKSEGLVAYWKLNEGSGDVAKDSSTSGNDLKGHTGVGVGNGGCTVGGDGILWKQVENNKVN